jgi:class 3 adenylate cyclase
VIDFETLSMTEIIRLQNLLQQALTRRFERNVALVFSDIVGSTPYFARFGDAAGRQLQQLHVDLLNKCLTARGGRIVDTAGDGALVTFPTASAATDALIEFQQFISRENATRARNHQLQVRMGVHFGPVLSDGVVVSGDSVNLCARVAASASIGEVRLTREVFQDLAAAQRLDCRPLGQVELKGVSRQIELFTLDWRDHSMFPTLFRIEETGEEVTLPQQDIISFGRLSEHESTPANDVVLSLLDPLRARQISRWHFELRRFADGFHLRPVSDGATEVDGELIAKGREVIIKPGSKIRVAHVLTLMFDSSPRSSVREGSDTTMIASDE